MSTKLSVKLLIDKRSRIVLYAEAGKDFVDFLFSLLGMPLATVIKLLTKQSMVGSIGELYESIENLNDMYVQSNQNKAQLLQHTSSSLPCENLLMIEGAGATKEPIYYTCANQHCGSPSLNSSPFGFSGRPKEPDRYISPIKGNKCPSCQAGMCTKATIVGIDGGSASSSQSDGNGGYVKDVVTYMITDDLVVTPMSTMSTIILLNKLSTTDVSGLEERGVLVGMEEGLKLLRASLESRTVLTDAFLGKQRILPNMI